MRIAIVCCTPYHLVNTLNLIENVVNGNEIDVYISDHFHHSGVFFEKLESNPAIARLFFVSDRVLSTGNVSYILKIRDFLFGGPEKMVDRPNTYNYDKLMFFTFSFFTYVLASAILNISPAAEMIMVEEGLMTYTISSHSPKELLKAIADRVLRWVHRRVLNLRLINHILLYRPELFVGGVTCPIRGLPMLGDDGTYFDYLPLSGLNSEEEINHTVTIFFDQAWGALRIEETLQMLKEISTVVGSTGIMIKMHPRSEHNKYSGLGVTSYADLVPWEIRCILEHSNQSILISHSSTALLTPHFLLKFPNPSIFLYRLYGPNVKSLDRLVGVIRENYPNSPLYVPNSLEELHDLLKDLGRGIRRKSLPS